MKSTSSATPVPKVIASGVTGGLTVILVWLLGLAGLVVPPEVASAITVVLSFIAGYLAPRSEPVDTASTIED